MRPYARAWSRDGAKGRGISGRLRERVCARGPYSRMDRNPVDLTALMLRRVATEGEPPTTTFLCYRPVNIGSISEHDVYPIRRGVCRVCGPVVLTSVIVLGQLGTQRHHETVFVSHPDHTPESGPFRLPPGQRVAVGSNTGGTATGLLAEAPTYSEFAGLRLVWPEDDHS
jgi:hypothetical protein